MIFVFGSNRAGRHGAGAAKTAHRQFGAEYGKGEGHYGDSYALPTKGYQIEEISIEEIYAHVINFMKYAFANPDLTFKVTQVGCGLGGHKAEDIAPLFKLAPPNCLFDTAWKEVFEANEITGKQYWGTF